MDEPVPWTRLHLYHQVGKSDYDHNFLLITGQIGKCK